MEKFSNDAISNHPINFFFNENHNFNRNYPPSEINEERGEEKPPLPSKGKASSKGKTNQQQKKKWNNSQPRKGNMSTRVMTSKKSEVSSLKSPAVEGGSD
jgi:hypothetical protein